MTTLPTYEEEAERLSREQGIFIPPTQLNQFSRAASKAMNAIVNALPYCTDSEYELVLELMRRTLECGKRRKE